MWLIQHSRNETSSSFSNIPGNASMSSLNPSNGHTKLEMFLSIIENELFQIHNVFDTSFPLIQTDKQ